MLTQTWFQAKQLRRLGAASAFSGFLLVLITNLLTGLAPSLDSRAGDIANLMIASQGALRLGTYLDTLGAALFLTFVIVLISIAEPDGGFLSRATALAMAIFVALAFGAHGALFGAVQAATHNSDPVSVKAAFMVWQGLSTTEAIQFVFVLSALGLLVISTRVLPVWLGYFALALAVLAFVLSIATISSGMAAPRIMFPAYALYGIWTLLAGVFLLRRA